MIKITATEMAEQSLCTLLSFLNHSIHAKFLSAPTVRRRSSDGVQFLAFTTFTSKPTPSFAFRLFICLFSICSRSMIQQIRGGVRGWLDTTRIPKALRYPATHAYIKIYTIYTQLIYIKRGAGGGELTAFLLLGASVK
jgi:hypothetical protein